MSLDEVGARANASRSQLYQYFQDRGPESRWPAASIAGKGSYGTDSNGCRARDPSLHTPAPGS
jgi:hypothetical protein